MKRILQFLFMLTMCLSAYSQALTFSDLKFSKYQFSDAQWDVGACMYSNTCNIYGLSGIGTTWNTGSPVPISTTQYIKFVASGDPNNPWHMYLYNSNGSVAQDLGLGRLAIQGDDTAGHHFFFFTNDQWNGTVFSLSYGFSNSNGFSFTGTGSPTVPQTNTFAAGGSSAPLASGQSVQPAQPAAPTAVSSSTTVTGSSSANTQSGIVTTTTTRTDTLMSDGSHVITTNTSSSTTPWPWYMTIGGGSVSNNIVVNTTSNITVPQQTKVDAWTNKTVTDGNKIYIDQVYGDGNTFTMLQEGSKNLINTTMHGSNNNVTARQGVQGVGQNEMKLSFEGNNNVVNLNQSRDTQGNVVGGNGHYLAVELGGWGTNLTVQQTNAGGVGGHYNETTIYGNGNSVIEKQTDNGNKIMFVKVDGALNTVDATQKGTGQHRLDVSLTGDRNNVSALQEGSTANNATLSLTNAGGPASVILQQNGGQNVSVSTSCATAGGCAPITIRQGY